jgi:hypothetical protein
MLTYNLPLRKTVIFVTWDSLCRYVYDLKRPFEGDAPNQSLVDYVNTRFHTVMSWYIYMLQLESYNLNASSSVILKTELLFLFHTNRERTSVAVLAGKNWRY